MSTTIPPLPNSLIGWSQAQLDREFGERRDLLTTIFEQSESGDGEHDLSRVTAIRGTNKEKLDEIQRLNREARQLQDAGSPGGVRTTDGTIRGIHLTKSNAVEQSGPFLARGEKIAPHFAKGTASARGWNPKDVRFGALIAGMVHGNAFMSQMNAVELMALSESSGPGGGYVVPEILSGVFIDEVRNLSRVEQAGALAFPMLAPLVRIPGWDTPPSAAWRGEGDSFGDSGGTFRTLTLSAKMIAGEATVSIELIEDAFGDSDALAAVYEEAMARAIAEGIDKAALIGKGTDNEPLGVQNVTGINSVSMGTNGATPTDYDKFLDVVYELENDNFEPGAFLYSARTANTLRKIVTGITSDKTKLEPPQRLKELPTLITNQMGNAQTQGTDTASSSAFCAEWRHMLIGYRPNLGIRVQADHSKKGDTGQVVLRFNARADIGLLHKPAFCTLLGLKA